MIRIPHFSLPRPTLLDGYIARQYGRILAMTTVGMLGLFYISSFIDKSDKLFKGQISLGMLLEFLFWSTPELLTYIIAIAVLLSGLVTVGLLTKNSELIVMRACGISLYRTALPMVVFALAAGAVLVGIQENVLATANRRADQLNHHIRTGIAADLRRAQSQVDRRARTARSITTSTTTRAGRSCTTCRCSSSIRRTTRSRRGGSCRRPPTPRMRDPMRNRNGR